MALDARSSFLGIGQRAPGGTEQQFLTRITTVLHPFNNWRLVLRAQMLNQIQLNLEEFIQGQYQMFARTGAQLCSRLLWSVPG